MLSRGTQRRVPVRLIGHRVGSSISNLRVLEPLDLAILRTDPRTKHVSISGLVGAVHEIYPKDHYGVATKVPEVPVDGLV